MQQELFMTQTHLTDIMKDFKLVTVKDSDRVQDVLSKLSANKILAAPTVDLEGKIHKSIDMLDLVAYAVAKLDLLQERTKKGEVTQIAEFLQKEIRNLPDFSCRNPFYTLKGKKSFKKAIQLLSHPNFHRIWIEEDNVLIGVLTQFRALEILAEHKLEFWETMKLKVFEVFPEARQTAMIDSSDLLINAFQKISKDRVSGVAVVDQKGILVGNISASDLKFSNFSNAKELLTELTHPIEEFLAPQKQGLFSWFFGGKKGTRLFEPVVVRPGDTLLEVMEKCITNRVHRVYVVDSERRPLGVISLGDLIAQFQFFKVPTGPFRG